MPVSDPKQIASMLVGELGHGDSASGGGDEHGEGQMDPGEETAGEEMMQALQNNDVASFVSALKSFLQLV